MSIWKIVTYTSLAFAALIAFIFLVVTPGHSADLKKMADQMFSPTVQINKNCSGSVVYSKRDDKTGKVETIILTAKHCLDAEAEYTVNVPVYQNNVVVKHEAFVATRRGVSYKSDLGLLVLRDTQTFFEKTAKLAPADVPLTMGEEVWTVGYPLGLALTVTQGLFGSAETLVDGKPEQYYRATPNAAPGNSGGALYHATASGDYELIGVTSRGAMQFFFVVFYVRAAEIEEYLKVAVPGLYPVPAASVVGGSK